MSLRKWWQIVTNNKDKAFNNLFEDGFALSWRLEQRNFRGPFQPKVFYDSNRLELIKANRPICNLLNISLKKTNFY